MEEENKMKVQVECQHHGPYFGDTIMFSGDYALLIEKEVKDDKLITIQTPIHLNQIVRIVYTRFAEIREAPEVLSD
jgi:hypothetical protein